MKTIKQLNLGYSKLLKKDVVVEYEWYTDLTCDGDRVPALKIKVVWKTCFGRYRIFECLGETKESVFEDAYKKTR